MSELKKLFISDDWKRYLFKHPRGYTVLENLIDWVSQTNLVIENVNDWNETLNEFMDTYDVRLSETTINKLTEWYNDGQLAEIINQDVFNMKANQEDLEILEGEFVNLSNGFDEHISTFNNRTGGILDPREYGAVGDGVADDTLALQQWLNESGQSCVLRNGVFRITEGLISTLNNRTIICEGATIVADSDDIVVLTVLGDNNRISVNIDGQDKARIGVLIKSKQCEVTNSRLINFHGKEHTAAAIRVENNGGVVISDNYIRNVRSNANDVFGDAMGSSRAIVVTAEYDSSEMNYIANNYIENIVGEEGDGIQLLFFNTLESSFRNSKGFILNNTIKNVNRRAIKIQANNVVVEGNKHINTLPLNELPNANNLIDVIHSHNVVIRDNDIDASHFLGIKITGKTDNMATGHVVENNRIKATTSRDAIFFEYCKNSSVKGNTIFNGRRAFAASGSQSCVIEGNIFYGGDSEQPAINIVANNREFVVRGNIGLAGTRLYLVQNFAPNCIVENNHSRLGRGLIRTDSTSVGSYYKNNTKEENSVLEPVIGNQTGQIVEDNINITLAD